MNINDAINDAVNDNVNVYLTLEHLFDIIEQQETG
jgi:hypothetical protein